MEAVINTKSQVTCDCESESEHQNVQEHFKMEL